MKTIITTIALVAIMLTSCKKKPMEVIKTNTVTVTDTMYLPSDTVYVPSGHDTITVVAQNLVGMWSVYKMENVNNGVSTYSNQSWIFNFTSTQLQENTSGGTGWDYTYNVTYGSNYVDIYYTASPTTYNLSVVGSEYRLTRVISASQSQIWYLKK